MQSAPVAVPPAYKAKHASELAVKASDHNEVPQGANVHL